MHTIKGEMHRTSIVLKPKDLMNSLNWWLGSDIGRC